MFETIKKEKNKKAYKKRMVTSVTSENNAGQQEYEAKLKAAKEKQAEYHRQYRKEKQRKESLSSKIRWSFWSGITSFTIGLKNLLFTLYPTSKIVKTCTGALKLVKPNLFSPFVQNTLLLSGAALIVVGLLLYVWSLSR